MTEEYLEYIAKAEISSANSYKVLLILLTKAYTKAQIAELLGVKPQNIAKNFKELEEMGLIEVDRVEGRNKFYRAINIYRKEEER